MKISSQKGTIAELRINKAGGMRHSAGGMRHSAGGRRHEALSRSKQKLDFGSTIFTLFSVVSLPLFRVEVSTRNSPQVKIETGLDLERRNKARIRAANSCILKGLVLC